jgi:hypothetical protein
MYYLIPTMLRSITAAFLSYRRRGGAPIMDPTKTGTDAT